MDQSIDDIIDRVKVNCKYVFMNCNKRNWCPGMYLYNVL